MDLKPSAKEALKLAGLERCIKRSQAMHLEGSWRCFMESSKGSCLLPGDPLQELHPPGCPVPSSQPSGLLLTVQAQMQVAFSVLSALPADFLTFLSSPDSFPASATSKLKSHFYSIIYSSKREKNCRKCVS